jgi:hypothetical protein
MKFLAAALLFVVVAQVNSLTYSTKIFDYTNVIILNKVAARDLSQYQPRSVLFPRPPVEQKNQYVPVKRPATVDTRGHFQIS